MRSRHDPPLPRGTLRARLRAGPGRQHDPRRFFLPVTSRRDKARIKGHMAPAARESEFFARAFIRRAEAPKQTPDVEYRFRHLRRDGTPDELPAIPTLAQALSK